MKVRPVGLTLVAALAGSALLLAAGPAGLVGAAGASTREATPARCAAYDGTHATASSSAPVGGMAGMPEMPGMPGTAGTAGTAGVDDSASHHLTQELRDRLARTPAGGTLRVQPGLYRGALVVDRPVTIVGVGRPILQGDGTGTVLIIRAAGTTVRDLVIEGSGPGPVGDPAGVKVEADHVVVKNLHIRDTFTGIRVEGAQDAQIIGNVIEGRKAHARGDGDMAGMQMGAGQQHAQTGRGDGVILFNAIRPVVAGNSIADVRDGVYLAYGDGPRIECNSIVGSRYALHSMYGKSVTVAANRFATNLSGPVMMYGGPVTLEENVIRDQHSSSTGFGALFLDVGGVRLLRNVIVSNRVGIQIEGQRDAAVELNTIALNQVGVALYPTARATLSQNSLVENTVQVLGLGPGGDGGDSQWSRDGVGNFWSNYRGYERPGSGVGEIPHVEGAAAGHLLARNPILLALASSPAFTLLRAVEQRSASQRPVSVDRFPLVDPRSPSLPNTAGHAAFGTGLLGAATLAICALALLGCARRRQLSSQGKPERTRP